MKNTIQIALFITPVLILGYVKLSVAEKSYQFENQTNTNPQQIYGDNNGTQIYTPKNETINQDYRIKEQNNFDSRGSSTTYSTYNTNTRNGSVYNGSTHIGDNHNGVTYRVYPNSHPYQ